MRTWYLACGLSFGLAICPPLAGAHEFYELDCCSDKDCAPYPTEHVTVEPGGYRLHTGELIGYHDPRIRQSPDGHFHLCAISLSPGENPLVRCFYIPPIGS